MLRFCWTDRVYTREIQKDALPTFYNITLRLEKRINIGAGRLFLMADVFNALNSAVLSRAYNEILNPRIWRFGVRFEF